MLSRLARIISVLFHPLLIPSYTTAMVIQFRSAQTAGLTDDGKLIMMGMMIISTCLLPSVIIVFSYYQGLISSLQMEERRDRVLPFLIVTVFYYFTYLFFSRYQLPFIYNGILISGFILAALMFLISYFWKISVHLAAIGGLTGVIWGIAYRSPLNMTWFIVAAFLLAGIVASARLYLNAHSQPQIYLGYAAGVITVFCCMMLV